VREESGSSLKILQIHNDYLSPGGETRSVNKIATVLEEHGHAVTRYWHDNSDLQKPNFFRKLRFPIDLTFNFRVYRDTASLAEKADLVHIHNLFPVLSQAAYYGTRKKKKPIVQHLQNYRLFCANGIMVSRGQISDHCVKGNYACAVIHGCQRSSRVLGLAYASQFWFHRFLRSYRIPDCFIAISSFVKDVFVKFGISEEKIFVLPHYVDTSLFESGKPDMGYYVYVGRLSHEKGIHTLVDAFLESPHLRLVIVGDGPDRKALQDRLCAVSNPRIELKGFLESSQIKDLLSKARALVLPSECYETFGLAALEALASGVPVIASRIGGIVDIVTESKTGFLFRAGDKAAILRAIDLLESMSQAGRDIMRANARRDALQRFNKEDYYNRLMRIYTSVLDRRQ
jgi:glycosyltransferase involved in cell wall biosynthesis